VMAHGKAEVAAAVGIVRPLIDPGATTA